MKYLRSLLSLASVTLVACVPAPSQHSMNGMDHGGMMGDSRRIGIDTFLPAQDIDPTYDIDITSFPVAKDSSVINVKDGDTIELNPTIVRKKITNKEIAMYGYNGQIPGPRINVQQGSTFTVKVTNKIDLPTAIHWHGLRLDNASDGAVGATQEAIEPGDSYIYTVKVPDEGIFWYHPHVREDIQQDMGLYGLIHVLPKNADAYTKVDREEYVILDDILLNNDGTPVPYGKNAADHTLMGRFGNTFLINGETKADMDVGLGEVVRYYFLNASNTRTYRVGQFAGSLLKRVGADGGRYKQEFIENGVTLSPSERVIVDVYFWDYGVEQGTLPEQTVALVESGPPSKPVPVLSATIVGGVVGIDRLSEFKKLRTNPDVQHDIDTFRPFFDKPVDHTLALTMTMHGGMGGMNMADDLSADGIEWEDSAMNEMSMGNMMQWKLVDTKTGQSNKDLMWNAKVGDTLKIRIVNDKNSPHPMQHPIHFHGQRFLVLSDNGITNGNLVWKDTVLVPAGHTVDILLDITNPGDWMFHCHIAEHLSNGMMGMLRVQ